MRFTIRNLSGHIPSLPSSPGIPATWRPDPGTLHGHLSPADSLQPLGPQSKYMPGPEAHQAALAQASAPPLALALALQALLGGTGAQQEGEWQCKALLPSPTGLAPWTFGAITTWDEFLGQAIQALAQHGDSIKVPPAPEAQPTPQAAWATFQERLKAHGYLQAEQAKVEAIAAQLPPMHVLDAFAGPSPLPFAWLDSAPEASATYLHFMQEPLQEVLQALQGQPLAEAHVSRLKLLVLPAHLRLDPAPEAQWVILRAGFLLLPETFRTTCLDEVMGHWKPRHISLILPLGMAPHAGRHPLPDTAAFQRLVDDATARHPYTASLEMPENPQPGACMAAFLTRKGGAA